MPSFDRSKSPRDPSRRRIWVYVAVGLFLLFDAYLITAALTSTRADPIASAETPQASRAPQTTPAPTPTALPAVLTSPVPATRILSAASPTVAWRAVSAICPDPLARPEVSTDSGATWTTTDANGPTGVTAIQSIDATNGSVAQLLGFAAADCSAQIVRTFVGGDNYSSANDKLDTAWYVNPTDRSELHGPNGVQPAPCNSVVALSSGPSKREAAILCADARVFATTDAAASWSAPLSVPGALTLTATPAGYVVLVAQAASGQPTNRPATTADATVCRGVGVVDVRLEPAGDSAGTLIGSSAGCYATAEAPAALAGNVAIASADGTLWLWIGDVTVRSTDGGRTWA